jgi:hypothetical protein
MTQRKVSVDLFILVNIKLDTYLIVYIDYIIFIAYVG